MANPSSLNSALIPNFSNSSLNPTSSIIQPYIPIKSPRLGTGYNILRDSANCDENKEEKKIPLPETPKIASFPLDKHFSSERLSKNPHKRCEKITKQLGEDNLYTKSYSNSSGDEDFPTTPVLPRVSPRRKGTSLSPRDHAFQTYSSSNDPLDRISPRDSHFRKKHSPRSLNYSNESSLKPLSDLNLPPEKTLEDLQKEEADLLGKLMKEDVDLVVQLLSKLERVNSGDFLLIHLGTQIEGILKSIDLQKIQNIIFPQAYSHYLIIAECVRSKVNYIRSITDVKKYQEAIKEIAAIAEAKNHTKLWEEEIHWYVLLELAIHSAREIDRSIIQLDSRNAKAENSREIISTLNEQVCIFMLIISNHTNLNDRAEGKKQLFEQYGLRDFFAHYVKEVRLKSVPSLDLSFIGMNKTENFHSKPKKNPPCTSSSLNFEFDTTAIEYLFRLCEMKTLNKQEEFHANAYKKFTIIKNNLSQIFQTLMNSTNESFKITINDLLPNGERVESISKKKIFDFHKLSEEDLLVQYEINLTSAEKYIEFKQMLEDIYDYLNQATWVKRILKTTTNLRLKKLKDKIEELHPTNSDNKIIQSNKKLRKNSTSKNPLNLPSSFIASSEARKRKSEERKKSSLTSSDDRKKNSLESPREDEPVKTRRGSGTSFRRKDSKSSSDTRSRSSLDTKKSEEKNAEDLETPPNPGKTFFPETLSSSDLKLTRSPTVEFDQKSLESPHSPKESPHSPKRHSGSQLPEVRSNQITLAGKKKVKSKLEKELETEEKERNFFFTQLLNPTTDSKLKRIYFRLYRTYFRIRSDKPIKEFFIKLNHVFAQSGPLEKKEILLCLTDFMLNPTTNMAYLPEQWAVAKPYIEQIIKQAKMKSKLLEAPIITLSQLVENHKSAVMQAPNFLEIDVNSIVEDIALINWKAKHHWDIVKGWDNLKDNEGSLFPLAFLMDNHARIESRIPYYINLFAASFTYHTTRHFKQLDSSEWCYSTFDPRENKWKSNDFTTGHIHELSKHLSHISHWVKYTLLTQPTEEKVTILFEFFLDVTKKLLDEGFNSPRDFASAHALYLGLLSAESCIFLIKPNKPTLMISKDYQSLMNQYHELFQISCKTLNTEITNSKSPIPLIHSISGHLTHIFEDWNDRYNQEFVKGFSAIITPISNQQKALKFEPNIKILNFHNPFSQLLNKYYIKRENESTPFYNSDTKTNLDNDMETRVRKLFCDSEEKK